MNAGSQRPAFFYGKPVVHCSMNIKGILRKITPRFLLKTYHYKLALIGAFAYGFPSRKLTVIGVTGTSGKSTTVDFITRIFEENGDKVASMSTVRFKIGEKEWKNQLKMTMPGRMKIQKFLKQAADAQCKYAVIEVTSEGIAQFRHKFIDFDAAVFTNLTPEHIESHGSFEQYRKEKLKLFSGTKNIHIINADDENARHFLAIPAKDVVTFGIKNPADVKPENVSTKQGISFSVKGIDFAMPLIGSFNAYNALAAIAVATAKGVPLHTCKAALEKVQAIPGRMEIVSKNPLTIVDYAHTPEQLELTYQSLKDRPLVCVLGSCGGGRDKWKRPVLGEIAGRYCKEIIITNEDPYDEDPMEIIDQVAKGAGGRAQKVPDRREAIRKAFSLTKDMETIIITGKGSETVMCVSEGRKILWSDRETVIDELKNRHLG